MADRRSYRQFCGLARSLDVVGERWTLLLVRELLLGPRRYGDLLESLPGLTTNLLARRLRQLEVDGLVKRVSVSGARGQAYELSERGAALEPVIMELGRWGGALLGMPAPDDRLDMAWGLISLKRRFRGAKNFRALFEIDARQFTLSFEDDYLSVKQRSTDAADVRITGVAIAFRRWMFMGAKLDELEAEGALVIDGKARARGRLLRAFDNLA